MGRYVHTFVHVQSNCIIIVLMFYTSNFLSSFLSYLSSSPSCLSSSLYLSSSPSSSPSCLFPPPRTFILPPPPFLLLFEQVFICHDHDTGRELAVKAVNVDHIDHAGPSHNSREMIKVQYTSTRIWLTISYQQRTVW